MKNWFFTLALSLFFSGCKQADIPPLPPQQQILGKWEITYLGNGEYRPPITNPSGYEEYLPDSVLLGYDYATKSTYRKKYWIDSLLHVGIPRGDGFLLKFDYEYRFNKNTLELNLVNYNAIFRVSKHKRIN